MFRTAELGRTVDKKTFRELSQSLRIELVELQQELRRRRFPVIVVFGEPVPLDDLLERKGSPRVYKSIAERVLETISALGQEERVIRAREFPA